VNTPHFCQSIREMITKLQKALREQRHQFAPVRVVEIPKPKGGTRPLGIATVEDRVVQTAMRLVVEPIFEADFHDCSYGYRPKRDAKQASIAIREDLYHRAWGVVEVDFKSYFTSIPHRKLMKLITQRIADGSLLKLIKQTLKVGVQEKEQVVPTKVGVPQGAPISPLYSNIYLNLLDQLWHKRGSRRSWVRRCTATPMMPFWYATKAPSPLSPHWRRSPRGWT
jgi:RNA-directed DNA polymerase